MEQNKKVRSYKRRTKSGKVVTVKSHTRKTHCSDTTKCGAGSEYKKKLVRPIGSGTLGPQPKKKK